MKKLLSVIALAMALNFMGLVGGAGYLWRTGHLDKDRANQIKAILFPPPAVSTSELAGGGEGPSTQPADQLGDLLKKAAGLSGEEQQAFVQRSFDARMAEMDLRQRQVADQQRQVDLGRRRLEADREALDAEKKKMADDAQQAASDATDQGFQDSLQLYTAMAPKQVKTIFQTLSDETIMRYLEAMSPRVAGKIIKEFKTPDETDRIQRVLERMRLQNKAGAGTQPTAALTPNAP